MKILVCIKQVPGTNKVEVDEKTGVLKRNGTDSKMNPYDLYALETALRIKEKYGGSVSVISMGPPQAKAVLYEAFAMGADEGALITDRKFGGADVLATSRTLSQGIKKFGEFDIILCGLQTTDGDTAQVGPEVAEMLNIPSICNIEKIEQVQDNTIIVDMDMPEDIERVRVEFPCLLTVKKDIFQPRLPSYIKQQQTQKKDIDIFTFSDMEDQNEKKYGLSGSPTHVERIFPPTSDKIQQHWQGTAQEISGQIYGLLREKKFIR
ncbi:electron transfer flavoprotein subunit beta/FixA family protein [Pectinatus brassicae]|uniref:Electron transfer flavoprotein small subunit n=1 Tax=Pectinatus brassicae TaxID=862415 RepID=A0A840UN06_9FIRM|nr:electron transfer flavoprotein subunit beta/FixA family protein [Pectinatus brassicae]MBB5337207.1 electron transfer flavoprotein beta subunit [Pectinatus brassicae]